MHSQPFQYVELRESCKAGRCPEILSPIEPRWKSRFGLQWHAGFRLMNGSCIRPGGKDPVYIPTFRPSRVFTVRFILWCLWHKNCCNLAIIMSENRRAQAVFRNAVFVGEKALWHPTARLLLSIKKKMSAGVEYFWRTHQSQRSVTHFRPQRTLSPSFWVLQPTPTGTWRTAAYEFLLRPSFLIQPS